MKRPFKPGLSLCALATTLLGATLSSGQTPLGTAFTYQGQLKSGGSPANGNFNMAFRLYDADTLGNPVGPMVNFGGPGGDPPVSVVNGLFTVQLDFGTAAYNGSRRWLQITVSGTPLSPRQELTPAPHARFSAAPWATSGNDLTNVNAGNVGIGTATPAAKLDVAGTVKSSGLQMTASPGAGRLLTSDAAGTGTWQPLPPIGLDGLSQSLQSQLLPLSSPSPSVLSVTGSAATGMGPYSVAVSGGYAYVVNFLSSSLQVINVSNPASPTVVGSASTAGGPAFVAVSGSYAYVANFSFGSMQIFNVSNPASPTLTGSAATFIFPNCVAVSGNYAYVVNRGSNLFQIFDVSNPASPTQAGVAGTGSGPISVAVSGNYAYVTNSNSNSLQVFDVSNPASPTPVGNGATTGSDPISVALSGSYAYVVNANSNSLQIFNVSNPAFPTLAGSTGTGGGPRSVAVSGGYAHVVNEVPNTLQVFNISNPASPTLAGTTATGMAPFGVAVSGGYTYVVNYSSADLQIFVGAAQFPGGATFAGNVGIGTTTPTEKLHVVGNICATGTIGACSDARYKTNVRPVSDALSLVEKLRPVRFDWKRDEFPEHRFTDSRQLGLIAQEVREVAPEVVQEGSDGYLSVDYGRLTPILAQAIKEQQVENRALRARVEALEQKLSDITEKNPGGVR